MQEIIRCTPPRDMELTEAMKSLEELPIKFAVCRNVRRRLFEVTCDTAQDGDTVHHRITNLGFTIHDSLAVRFLRWLSDDERLQP